MPFYGSTIAQTEAELWGIQDSAENAAFIWQNVAITGADLGGPQDGVFGELNSVDTELNASGGPRGWLPGLFAAILGLIFGSIAWLSPGLDQWLQWAKSNAMDGFNDFLEGMRALIEAGPQAAINAIQGLVAAMNNNYNANVNYTNLVGNAANASTSALAQKEAGDIANLNVLILDEAGSLQQEINAINAAPAGVSPAAVQQLQAQEQLDVGNLKNLIDQNFFTLQQQEQADTQNLQRQIQQASQPNTAALQALLAIQVLPQLSTLTQTQTQLQNQLNQDEQQCIDPLCQNLGQLSKEFGLLGQLGTVAAVLAFIAACMADPGGVATGINAVVTPLVDSTSTATTGV